MLTYLEYQAESSFFDESKINELKDEYETKFQQTEKLINKSYALISQLTTYYIYIEGNDIIKKYEKNVTVLE